MLRGVEIENFKAIGPGRLRLDLAPLTVLVGPSGAGKSSVLDAIGLTAQSALEDEPRQEIVLEGSLGAFGHDLRAFYCGRATAMAVRVEIDAAQSLQGLAPWIFAGARVWPPKRLSYEWSRVVHKGVGAGRAFAPVDWGHAFWLDADEAIRWWATTSDFSEHGRTTDAQLAAGLSGSAPRNVAGWVPARVLPRIDPAQWFAGNEQEYGFAARGALNAIRARFVEVLARVHALRALRGPELVDVESGPRVVGVGVHGENTIRLLAQLSTRTRPALRNLQAWCERFGLPSLETGVVEGSTLRGIFRDPVTDRVLPISSAASGAHQGLVLAAHLLLSPERSTLLVEEPEADMHPKFEQKLPDLFADALDDGRQVILTTHSEVLLAALGNAVAKGRLHRDAVRVYELERSRDAGVTARDIPIDDRGYLEGWVKSYVEVQEALLEEAARAGGGDRVGTQSRRGHARAGRRAPRKARRRP